MHSYSKLKDRDPSATIALIEHQLEQLGFTLSELICDHEVPNCYSCRITLNDTPLGTNGKGTTPEYCRASALAELIERLSNHYMDWTFSHEELAQNLDFYSVRTKSLIKINRGELMRLYASNGMCAGNTPEEAITQGLAEIVERIAQSAVLHAGVVQPVIGREHLADYPELLQSIDVIEQSGYDVRLLDASLGRGLPVVSIVMMDRRTGKFGVRFGSHISFPIAVERTLTEALQGRGLQYFCNANQIASAQQVCGRTSNLTDLFCSSEGEYPPTLLCGEPQYFFSPWDRASETLSNREMMLRYMRLLMQDGHDLLIRDVSHLGMPAYHILAPEQSNLDLSDQTMGAQATKLLIALDEVFDTSAFVSRLFDDIGSLDRAQVTSLFRIISNLLQNKRIPALSALARRHITSAYPGGTFAAKYMQVLLLYALGRTSHAEKFMESLVLISASNPLNTHFRAVLQYLRLLRQGLTPPEIRDVLFATFSPEEAAHTADLLEDSSQTLRRAYPRLSCVPLEENPPCESCEARSCCVQKESQKVQKTIADAISAHPIDQNRVGTLLQDFLIK